MKKKMKTYMKMLMRESRRVYVETIGMHNIYTRIGLRRTGRIPRNQWRGKNEYCPYYCLTCNELLPSNYGLHFCK